MARRTLKQELTDLILERLPEVDQRTSRFSPRDAFWVGSREIAHFHDRSELDLRLTRKEIRARRAELSVDRRVTLRGSSDWLEVRFPRRTDLPFVLELVEVAAAANGRA